MFTCACTVWAANHEILTWQAAYWQWKAARFSVFWQNAVSSLSKPNFVTDRPFFEPDLYLCCARQYSIKVDITYGKTDCSSRLFMLQSLGDSKIEQFRDQQNKMIQTLLKYVNTNRSRILSHIHFCKLLGFPQQSCNSHRILELQNRL